MIDNESPTVVYTFTVLKVNIFIDGVVVVVVVGVHIFVVVLVSLQCLFCPGAAVEVVH